VLVSLKSSAAHKPTGELVNGIRKPAKAVGGEIGSPPLDSPAADKKENKK